MIEFGKAHACGNDFLIVEEQQHMSAATRSATACAALARALCARTTGIGADGVEFLARTSEREGRIRLHNADGSLAEISGNGTRCVAAWMAHQAGLQQGDEVRLHTDAGLRTCHIVSAMGTEYRIVSAMGVPTVARHTVTLDDGFEVDGAVVATGNPHFVVLVQDESFANENFTVAGRDWQRLGAAICVHRDFPAQTNVEFVRRIADDTIEIRIFERGVGPTSSSGTGTSASAAAMIALEGAPAKLRVRAPGGEQIVEWAGDAATLLLTGPAVVLASGRWLAGEPL